MLRYSNVFIIHIWQREVDIGLVFLNIRFNRARVKKNKVYPL